ncbi:HTH domain-containing protein [Haloarcula virus HVTV-2]|uniref:HTH cro/C1-type domain-containing protein n=1 Tax=Haloarcula vallismortis tailed virus 1 TaxID=1262528 RepID=L7TNG7_9CAUD|nr:hypothetical protein HVTV1_27 [Haloarcula vallismortis tailed virus 1]AGC34397.1 hypothetical protein HVTV1_27 [Haloarcula vallismortis tailed virus 1]UBF22834.1 HTH domain-containing protein [Haloarcula virus HVTV-2]
MASGMGNADDEMNRRALRQQERLNQMSTQSPAVGRSSPDDDGEVSTTDTDAAAMLEHYNSNGEGSMTKEKKKLKSPRYSDVPSYTLEALDTDTLKDDVFPALDFSEAERQAAGALVRYADQDLTQAEVAEKAGVSSTTISRTRRSLTTSRNPDEDKREILRYARENPDASNSEIADKFGTASSNVKAMLREYRHARIVCEVEVEETTDDDESTTGETTGDDEQDVSDGDDDDTQSDEADAVQKDLSGDGDVTYKYDPKDKSKKQTRGGQSLKSVRDQSHLISLFRELDRRLREVENNGVEADVPSAFKGRVSSLESQLEGVQSVVDRIENQQSNLERFVEDELDTSSDFEALEQDVQDLKEQCQGIVEATEQDWEETTLGQRVDRIEESLSSHKEAIQDLRESGGGGTSFSTEEKRKVIVALAENGQDELIDRVLDEF